MGELFSKLNKRDLTLGIIPARGGSKGVPRKNIKLLDGEPLIAYTIKAAHRSMIDRTIVSSDDDEIIAVARSYGAEVPFKRPLELATEDATSLSVVLHALDYVEKEDNFFTGFVVFLQPTSPFRTHLHINTAIDLLKKRPDIEGVTSVVPVSEHPYFAVQMNPGGVLKEYISVDNKPLIRQDLPTLYMMSDAVVVVRRRYFYTVKPDDPVLPFRSMLGFEIDRISAMDINEQFDFELCELLMRYNNMREIQGISGYELNAGFQNFQEQIGEVGI